MFQEDVPGSAAHATWSVAGDSVPGSGPYQVVFLTRLTADAPLPPGLESWPRPGEAVLSPALRDHPAAKDITTRYGKTVGTIGAEGLQSPDELYAYVVPHVPAQGGNVRPITGYGPSVGPTFYTTGQQDYAKPEWTFLVVIGMLLVLPAAVLLTVAARTGSHSRDRRTALVEVLGATPRSRALIVVGEALRPVVAGTSSRCAPSPPLRPSTYACPGPDTSSSPRTSSAGGGRSCRPSSQPGRPCWPSSC